MVQTDLPAALESESHCMLSVCKGLFLPRGNSWEHSWRCQQEEERTRLPLARYFTNQTACELLCLLIYMGKEQGLPAQPMLSSIVTIDARIASIAINHCPSKRRKVSSLLFQIFLRAKEVFCKWNEGWSCGDRSLKHSQTQFPESSYVRVLSDVHRSLPHAFSLSWWRYPTLHDNSSKEKYE